MIKAIFLSVLLITAQLVCAQADRSRIDNLRTNEEIEQLIDSLIFRTWSTQVSFKLRSINDFRSRYGDTVLCRRIADSLQITQPYYKADLDQNGFTDLLAIGDIRDFFIFVVMNYGGDSLVLNRLTRRSFQECTFPKIIDASTIRYYYMSDPDWKTKDPPSLQQKDLVFKFGDFVELNAHPPSYTIEKIGFQTTGCFGTCPVFSITIEKDRTATFKAQRYNVRTGGAQEVKGTFTTTLQQDAYNEIYSLLNYIDFPRLKDNYAVNWTDDQTSTLTVTYNNGQVKQIRDYGMIGTYGLDRLYQLLRDLRFNQDWK